tara:strand:+ start:8445 stop:9245 length:801 start_codon:yes stop_codon:yes gene_type:complete
MLGPDGEFLCQCSDKKIKWYLDRELAELVQEENPRTIKLQFKPNGPGHKGDAYYEQEFENKCVVCGLEEDLTSHHIVPYCYRSTLTEDKKCHNYHDVVALCVECHDRYERLADKLKIQLAEEYDAPLAGVGYFVDEHSKTLRKAAGALFRHQAQLPPARLDELRKSLIQEAELDAVTKHLCLKYPRFRSLFFDHLFPAGRLEELSGRPYHFKTDDFKTHGQIITEQMDDAALHEFVKRWRNHFLDGMNPEFMPDHWDVDRTMWNIK